MSNSHPFDPGLAGKSRGDLLNALGACAIRVQSRHSRRNPRKSRGLPCETVLSSFGKESELVKKRRFP